MIQIHIRLSAGLAQSIGLARMVVTLPDAATVADAISHLLNQHPGLNTKMHLALPFVAGQQVTQSAPLVDGQELALLLPAAGGVDKE